MFPQNRAGTSEKHWMAVSRVGCNIISAVDAKSLRNFDVDTFVELYSTITCPECGHSKRELMPTDACQFFYECEGCGRLLKPLRGDCCVFCSYGDIKCPPIQEGNACSC